MFTEILRNDIESIVIGVQSLNWNDSSREEEKHFEAPITYC